MGFERNDRRYGYSGDRYAGDRGYGEGDRSRFFGGSDRWEDDRARSYGDYGNYGGGSGSRDYRGDRFNDRPSESGRSSGGYGYQDRGFFDRAGDEVRSWFGDEEAERRRRMDERFDRYAERGSEDRGYGYRSRHDHDPNYRTWRDRQLESLDRDYDEYRRENRSKFNTEFGSWRAERQTQRGALSKVTEHMDVVGSDGAHVGTVDKVSGDRILLTKSDSDAGGRHHSIPSRWIESVDDKVTIRKTAEDAKAHWRDEERNSAFFNEDGSHRTDKNDAGRDDASGPHILNRSFSGTY